LLENATRLGLSFNEEGLLNVEVVSSAMSGRELCENQKYLEF